MTIAEQRERIGTTILDQLARTSGGAGENRLRAMVGATNIQTLISRATDTWLPPRSPGVGFRFRGSKEWNGIEIYLDQGNDTYSIRFYRMRLEGGAGTVLTLGEWMDDIYADDLEGLFRDETGLDIHL